MANSDIIGNILLVDDESHITDLLSYNLSSERYAVSVVTRAADVLSMDLNPFCLVIVDAMSQPYSGYDLLCDLKGNPATQHIPVIVLSHDEQPSAVVDAFDAGADDFVLKPFSLRELLARIRSILRRSQGAFRPAQKATSLSFSTLEVDLITRQVRDQGMLLPLTKTEYAILVFLLKNKNNFFNRAQIFNEVWRDSEYPANDRIVDTNISRLRKKLGDIGAGLVNKTGLGYAFIDKSC